jgi:hypothetical protein
MKTASKALVGIIVVVALVAVIVRITGLNPNGRRPGLWLSGNLVISPVSDWSFANNYPTIEVQTRTWYGIPHSVTIWGVGYQDHLYLQAFGNWKRNVVRDPHVRIKIGNDLYDGTAMYVTNPDELWIVAQNMNKKYGDKWPLPKQVFPNVFLREGNN